MVINIFTARYDEWNKDVNERVNRKIMTNEEIYYL